jgi:hypothetical protein
MTYPNDPLESPWRYDGTYQARHLALLDLIRIACGSGGGGGGYDFNLLNQEATQLLIKTVLESLDTKLPSLVLQGDALKVHVSNQIDLTTITSYLLDIKNSVASINTNTDGIEGLISDTITAINNGATSINGNLTDIITELQGLDANTDGIEATLTDILNKIIAAPATEATQLLIKSVLDSILTNLGNPFQAGGNIGNTAFGVNNGAGASAVNVQDGGNSITVDAVSLPLPTGAATETTLQSIDTGIDALILNTGAADNLDAFERLRTSNPTSVFGAQLTYGLQPLVYEPITSGTGATITHDTTNRAALLSFASTGVAGTTVFQSYEHIRYQEGKSQLILISFNFKESIAGVRKFVGYSDGTNGIEFTSINGVHSFRVLSNSSEGNETVDQANWSLNTFSTLDLSKTQLLVIDFQALYVGKVRIGFEIDGDLTYCHEFKHANAVSNPYIATANLPIRSGMIVESGTATTSMNFICCNVSSEGGVDNPYGVPNSINSAVTATNNTRTHLLSVRPRTTFGGFTNRVKIIETEIEITVTGNSPISWEMCIGQAITGTTTFANVNTNNSAIEFNTAGTLSGTPTLVIDRGYVPSTNQNKGAQSRIISVKVPITLDAAGLQRLNGTITLVATGLGGNSLTYTVLKWIEIY